MLFFQITNVSNHGGKYLMKEQQNLPTKNKKKRILPAIIVAIVITVAIIITTVYNLSSNRRDRRLALAEKYMSELNYEAAILAYKAAIEIDPKCEDAYLQLLDLYIAMEAYDMAEEVIAQAENNLDDEIILAMREKTNTLLASADTEADNKSENTNQKEYETTTEAGIHEEENTEVEYTMEWIDGVWKVLANGVVDETFSGEFDYSDGVWKVLADGVVDENSTAKCTFVNGVITKWGIKWAGGQSGSHIEESQYDASGRRVKYVVYNSDGSVDCLYTFDETDSYGNTTKYTRYNADGNVDYWYICEYENKLLIKVTEYDAAGSISYRKEYEYDANGNETKNKIYNADGVITYWCEYEYDANGNMTKSKICNADGSINTWSELEYYENGKHKKNTYYSADGSVSEVSEYDTDGDRKDTTYRTDGSVSSISEYNSAGYITKSISYDSDGGSQVTEYD